MDTKELAVLIAKLQGIAQTGRKYGKDPFDNERYEELGTIAERLLTKLVPNADPNAIDFYLTNDEGYATPKVDIRAVVFNDEHKLLLVKEKSDQMWSLPGGWGDIGYSPFEVAEKEVFEEASIRVAAKQLLAVKDKAKHPYPPELTYVYKFFICCTPLETTLHSGLETSAANFFSEKDALNLLLSLQRVLSEDIQQVFAGHFHGQSTTYCD